MPETASACLTAREAAAFLHLNEKKLYGHLGTFLAGGGRKIDRWYGTLKVVEVSFDDEEAGFRNINTRDELVEAAKDFPRTNHG